MRKYLFTALASCALLCAPVNAPAQDNGPKPLFTEPITKQPKGRMVKNQVRKALSFYTDVGGANVDSVDYYIGNYVIGDDDCVYLKNPFTFFPTQSYLKLECLNGDTLVAHMPQAIFINTEEIPYYASRMVLKAGSQGMTYGFEQNADGTYNTDMRFLFRGDTLTLIGEDNVEGDYPKVILGLTTLAGIWKEAGEVELSVRPTDKKPLSLPQGVKPQLYQLSHTGFYGDATDLVEVAFADNKVYVSNPYSTTALQWAEGEIKGNSVVFARQYLGPNESDGYHIFFVPGVYSETAPDFFDLADTLRFNYDNTAKSLTATDLQSILINVGDRRVFTAAAYINPSLSPYTATAGKPANPEITSFGRYGEEAEGEGYLQFEFPSEDVHAQPLFKNNLYYKVYTAEGKALTFSPEKYSGLDTEITEVPYGLNDNTDFFMADDSHKFYFFQAADSLGLQTVYKGEQELSSDIVWTTGRTTTGISQPAISQTAAEVRYYDLQGRRLSQPRRGVCIRQRVMANGSVVNDKTIK